MNIKDCNKSAMPKKRLFLRFALGLAVPIALLNTGSIGKTIASAIIDSNGTFENGLGAYRKLKTCCNYSLSIVDSPVRAGTKAARFELRNTEARRAELRSINTVPANSEAWYGFSVYLPDDWAVDRGANDIIAQYGAPPDRDLGETESRGGPPLSLGMSGENLQIVRRWDPNPVTTPKSKVGEETINLGPYQRGKWMDFVIHIKWSHKSDGFIQVYKDGKLVVDKKGPTNRNDQKGIFFNTGIYKPKFETQPGESDVEKRILYFDEIRIGNADARYEDVAPRGNGGGNPKPDPEPSQEIRVEAENMFLSAYRIESPNSAASNASLISLRNAINSTDTASSTFTGASGKYDVYLGYFDENDGVANLQVSVGGVRLASFQLDQNLGIGNASEQTLVRKKVAGGLSINKGARIEIKGTTNKTEWARVDYIDFVPIP